MKFNFFSSPDPATLVATARSASSQQRIDTERVALTGLLYRLLARLPQSNNLQANTEQLCRTILDDNDNLRFIWVGIREAPGGPVPPLVIEGEYAGDCSDWSLPDSCFDGVLPYSQAALENVDAAADFPSLFAPWRGAMDRCTAHCALAIPLRSERSGVCGLMVFYAADLDYFSRLGVAPFHAFCHIIELIWRQSNTQQLLMERTQTDALTGLMNRRKTVFVLTKAIEQAGQTGDPLSILMCRLEGFDKLNDVYGWFDADAILAAFAGVVGSRMPPMIQAGRWTGVEFLYVLPGFDAARARGLAEELTRYLQRQAISVKSWSIRLTVQVGVANHSGQTLGIDDLIQQAIHQMQPAQRQLI
ncbi:GGDEF domain-containing protein [Actimicrobium antarcticum]|uniref:diguanylate cyclase n=1 Tax=Actimicrobium antarcticum TaxID=1051899 RepID=A0ABP7SNR3_9BURK